MCQICIQKLYSFYGVEAGTVLAHIGFHGGYFDSTAPTGFVPPSPAAIGDVSDSSPPPIEALSPAVSSDAVSQDSLRDSMASSANVVLGSDFSDAFILTAGADEIHTLEAPDRLNLNMGGGDDGGADKVIYRVDARSGHWIAHDGGDTVLNFKLGQDSLVFRGFAYDAADFSASEMARSGVSISPMIEWVTAASAYQVTGIVFSFSVSGKVFGSVGSGNRLTIKFAESLDGDAFIEAIGGEQHYSPVKNTVYMSGVVNLFGEAYIPFESIVQARNHAPQGVLRIMGDMDGYAMLGETLRVDIGGGVLDADYAAPRHFDSLRFQWIRLSRDGEVVKIAGATESSYTITLDDIGARIRATAQYDAQAGSQQQDYLLSSNQFIGAALRLEIYESHPDDKALTRLDINDGGWTIAATGDSAHFRVASDGRLYLNNLRPDFETPEDANGDNVYEISLTHSRDGIDTRVSVSITVHDLDDSVPHSYAQRLSLLENEYNFEYAEAESELPQAKEYLDSIGDTADVSLIPYLYIGHRVNSRPEQSFGAPLLVSWSFVRPDSPQNGRAIQANGANNHFRIGEDGTDEAAIAYHRALFERTFTLMETQANIKFVEVEDTPERVGLLRIDVFNEPVSLGGVFSSEDGYTVSVRNFAHFSTYAHEIGHFLGLKHPFQSSPPNPDDPQDRGDTFLSRQDFFDRIDTVMSYYGTPFSRDAHRGLSGLSQWDARALQILYGASTKAPDGLLWDVKTPLVYSHYVPDNGRGDIAARLAGSAEVNAFARRLEITAIAALNEDDMTTQRLGMIEVIDEDNGSFQVYGEGDSAHLFELRYVGINARGNAQLDIYRKTGALFDYETASQFAEGTRGYEVAFNLYLHPHETVDFRLLLEDVAEGAAVVALNQRKPTSIELDKSQAWLAEGALATHKLTDITLIDDGFGTNIVYISRIYNMSGDDISEASLGLFQLRDIDNPASNAPQYELWVVGAQDLRSHLVDQVRNVEISVTANGAGVAPTPQIFQILIEGNRLENAPVSLNVSSHSIVAERIDDSGYMVARQSESDARRISQQSENTYYAVSNIDVFEIRNENEIWIKGGITLAAGTYQTQVSLTGTTHEGRSPAIVFELNVVNVGDTQKPTSITLSNMSLNLATGGGDNYLTSARKLADIGVQGDDEYATHDFMLAAGASESASIFEIRRNDKSRTHELWLYDNQRLMAEQSYMASITLIDAAAGDTPSPIAFTLTAVDTLLYSEIVITRFEHSGDFIFESGLSGGSLKIITRADALDGALFEVAGLNIARRDSAIFDYENPHDASMDNIYEIRVRHTDDGVMRDYQFVIFIADNPSEFTSVSRIGGHFASLFQFTRTAATALIDDTSSNIEYLLRGEMVRAGDFADSFNLTWSLMPVGLNGRLTPDAFAQELTELRTVLAMFSAIENINFIEVMHITAPNDSNYASVTGALHFNVIVGDSIKTTRIMSGDGGDIISTERAPISLPDNFIETNFGEDLHITYRASIERHVLIQEVARFLGLKASDEAVAGFLSAPMGAQIDSIFNATNPSATLGRDDIAALNFLYGHHDDDNSQSLSAVLDAALLYGTQEAPLATSTSFFVNTPRIALAGRKFSYLYVAEDTYLGLLRFPLARELVFESSNFPDFTQFLEYEIRDNALWLRGGTLFSYRLAEADALAGDSTSITIDLSVFDRDNPDIKQYFSIDATLPILDEAPDMREASALFGISSVDLQENLTAQDVADFVADSRRDESLRMLNEAGQAYLTSIDIRRGDVASDVMLIPVLLRGESHFVIGENHLTPMSGDYALYLKSEAALDYETSPSHTAVIKLAGFDTRNSVESLFNLRVLPVDERPEYRFVQQFIYELPENTPLEHDTLAFRLRGIGDPDGPGFVPLFPGLGIGIAGAPEVNYILDGFDFYLKAGSSFDYDDIKNIDNAGNRFIEFIFSYANIDTEALDDAIELAPFAIYITDML